MPKYSKKTQELVEKTMHRKKEGKLYSGSGDKVTDNKQGIAIALSEAREKGYKLPDEKETGSNDKKKTKPTKTTSGVKSKRSAQKTEKSVTSKKEMTGKTAARKSPSAAGATRKTTTKKEE